MLALYFALAVLVQIPDIQARPDVAQISLPAARAEDLLPARALAVVRVRSLDRLAEIGLEFQRIQDSDAQPVDLLAMIGAQSGLQARWDLVDRTQPVLLAVTNSRNNQPAALTFIASCKDAAAFSADPAWKRSGWTCTPAGSFVVVATEPGPERLAAESPLRAGLDRGDVVARVDFAEVMAQFGDEFTGQMQASIDESLDAGAPEAAVQMQERMIDLFTTWLDSIETFGATFQHTGGRTQLALEMVALPGSSLATVERVDTRPLEGLIRCVDPASPILFAGAFDWSKVMKELFTNVIDLDALAAMDPEAGDVRKQIDALVEIYDLLGPCTAGGMRFSKEGLSASYALQPKDAPKLIEAYRKVVSVPDSGVTLEGPTPGTIGEVDVQRFRIRVDPKAHGMQQVDNAYEAGQALGAEMMSKLFGSDAIPFTYALHAGRMLATMGPDALMEGALARSKGGAMSPAGRELATMIGTLNPGFALRIDAPLFARGVLDLWTRVAGAIPVDGEETAALFQGCGPLWVTGGLDQRTWRWTIDADALNLARAISQMRQLATEHDHGDHTEPVSDARLAELELMGDLMSIDAALLAWADAHEGRYPTSLDSLLEKNARGRSYVMDRAHLVDPWDRAYLLAQGASPGELPRVFTLGADGKFGGDGLDRDVDRETLRR